MTDIQSLLEKWYLIAPVSNYGNPGITDKEFLCVIQRNWHYITNPAELPGCDYTRQQLEEMYLRMFNRWYESDLKWYVKESPAHISLSSDIKRVRTQKKWFFMTIGFDDKTITVQGIKDSIAKLNEIKDLDLDRYVVEKFRRNPSGEIYEHHHIHTLIYTDKPKSKVIQYVYQKLKKYVSAPNFIDLKREQPIDNYIKYINGDKCDSKLECIEMDRKWRQLNNL